MAIYKIFRLFYFNCSKVPNKRGVLISRGLEIYVKYNKRGFGISGGVEKWLIGQLSALFDQVDTFCIEK